MPQELLFDLSNIDLNAVDIGPDEVGRLNPQSGDMRHLDRVIWFGNQQTDILGVKQVRPDEFWVAGHIPGRPILPGVLMIEAVAQLSSIMYRVKSGEDRFLGFLRADKVAFRGQVRPGDTLLLMAHEVSFTARRFISDTQAVVDGSLVFEGRVTGMVM